MPSDLIAQLLSKQYREPGGGPERPDIPDVQVRSVVIADSLEGREAELVDELALGKKLVVVSDADTHDVLGRRVERALGARFQVQSLILGHRPHADEHTLSALAASLAPGTDALIAVGSGTINDLCKMTAARLERPYAVFGTAPSMNGYASVSASIATGATGTTGATGATGATGGFKRSLPARAPAGVFLDLTVLSRAPLRLIRGGLGECVCRPTAQADWLLAHLLLDEPYRDLPFVLLAAEEEELFAHSEALVGGDLEAMGRLARTLVLSGFGMTICGGSYPASQGEHLIAHYMGMMSEETDSLHGEQIAVSALFMAALQQRVLAMNTPPVVHASALTREDLHAHFGPARGEQCWQEFARKRITADRARELNHRLAAGWEGFRARFAALTRPPEEMRAVLERAGAPVAPRDLGWPEARFRDACNHAREIRDRFTFLDLAADSGIAIVL